MKKLLAIVISVCLVLGVCAGAFAAAGNNGLRERGFNADMLRAIFPSSDIQTVDSPVAGEFNLAGLIGSQTAQKAAKRNSNANDYYALLEYLFDEEDDEDEDDEDEDWYEYLEELELEDLIELYELLYYLFEILEPEEILELIAGLAELAEEVEIAAAEEYDLEALLAQLAA